MSLLINWMHWHRLRLLVCWRWGDDFLENTLGFLDPEYRKKGWWLFKLSLCSYKNRWDRDAAFWCMSEWVSEFYFMNWNDLSLLIVPEELWIATITSSCVFSSLSTGIQNVTSRTISYYQFSMAVSFAIEFKRRRFSTLSSRQHVSLQKFFLKSSSLIPSLLSSCCQEMAWHRWWYHNGGGMDHSWTFISNQVYFNPSSL